MIGLPGPDTGHRPTGMGARNPAEPSRALSIAACCPMSFPAPATSPITTRSTPPCGFSRPGAPISRSVTTARALPRCFRSSPRSSNGISRGTRYGIRVDPQDGLLSAGEPGVQLTWMDAKLGDWVVTPRIGKPVEINALWYNALCIMADFAAAARHARRTAIASLPSGCAPALPGSTTSGPAVFTTCSTARPAMTARSGRTRSWRSACRTARSRRPGSSRCVGAVRPPVADLLRIAFAIGRPSRLPAELSW